MGWHEALERHEDVMTQAVGCSKIEASGECPFQCTQYTAP